VRAPGQPETVDALQGEYSSKELAQRGEGMGANKLSSTGTVLNTDLVRTARRGQTITPRHIKKEIGAQDMVVAHRRRMRGNARQARINCSSAAAATLRPAKTRRVRCRAAFRAVRRSRWRCASPEAGQDKTVTAAGEVVPV